jgi:hypothetical protein
VKRSALAIAACIALLAIVGTLVASSAPDGLERVAADLGFARQETALYHAPFAEYAVRGIPGPVAGAVAALVGAALAGALAWAAGRALARPSRTP